MRLVAAVLLAVCVLSQTTCPNSDAPNLMGGAFALDAGFQYPYVIPKNAVGDKLSGSVYLTADSTWNGKFLFIRVKPEDTNAENLQLNPRIGVGAQVTSYTDTNNTWAGIKANLVATGWINGSFMFTGITAPTQIWVTFWPTCSTTGCSFESEIQIETALLLAASTSSSPTNFAPMKLVDQRRSMLWSTPVLGMVSFWTNVSALPYNLYADLVIDDTLTSSVLIRYFWNFNATASLTTYYSFYPNLNTTGEFVTQVPFTANQTGIWYFSAVVIAGGSIGSNVDWSFKTGVGQPPCSGAGSVTANLLLVLALLAAKHFC